MNTNQYVILRENGARARALPNFGMRGGVGGAVEPLIIEQADLTEAELSDLARDQTVRSVAHAMPYKLIEPMAVDSGVAVAQTAWGIEAIGAHRSTADGSGVVVAVLDTGIEKSHPAFNGVELVIRDFTGEGDQPSHWHGTHCAGTIFGRDVAGQRIGVARGISKAIIGKVLGNNGGSTMDIVNAIQWAVDEGAHVISMSLGIDFPGYVDSLTKRGMDTNPATSQALEAYRANVNLMTTLAEHIHSRSGFGHGTIIVAAAGNESERPDYEIAVAPPAAAERIISVSALAQGANSLVIAPFSNTQVNLAAPGVDILSAKLNGTLDTASGTSMACPHVAGVAALWGQKMLERNGRIDAENLYSRVIGGCTHDSLDPSLNESQIGTGIVQAPA